MHKKRTNARRRPVDAVAPARPPWPDRPVAHRQLMLFVQPWQLAGNRRTVGPPRDQALAEALDVHVTGCAARAGWPEQYTSNVRCGIRLLLGMQDTPGAAIAASEAQVLTQLRLPVRTVMEVLDEVGMLDDDRTPAITRWFEHRTARLPEPMASELRVWFDVMHVGTTTPPRTKPRHPTTIKIYLAAVLPALKQWTDDGHYSLREITHNDVVAALPPAGVRRGVFGRGARSIFATLKARKVIFANPMINIETGSDFNQPPACVDLDGVRLALNSPDPARTLISSLAAYHGLRSGQLIALQLTDVRDRQLYVDGRLIPLADTVRRTLREWLDHRAARWPLSTNPHLFIHFRTAARADPVGRRWIKLTLDLPGGVQALRQDRILHEAIATGGDTRRLCDLFGLSIGHATRYTDAIREPALDRR